MPVQWYLYVVQAHVAVKLMHVGLRGTFQANRSTSWYPHIVANRFMCIQFICTNEPIYC
jgi:hypothetical protein